MRLLLAFALACCGGCEAIDDPSFFHVVGDDGGAAFDLAAPTDAPFADAAPPDGLAATPDFAATENLDGGPPPDMQSNPGDMQMPCVIGQSLLGGCYVAN